MTFIDTHTHIYGEEFDDDRSSVIARAEAVGATQILLPNVDEKSLPAILHTCEEYPHICRPMIGLHPEEVNDNYREVLKKMKDYLSRHTQSFCAVGEIGLDFYWDSSKAQEQEEAFIEQLQWSIDFKKPVSIHLRAAHERGVHCLSSLKNDLIGGVFHCFGGTQEEAETLLSFNNFYFGIGGLVTFKKSPLPEVLSSIIPLSRVVVETDAPYLTPVPYRGKRNEPAYIPYIVEKLAEIYDVDKEKVAEITTQNAIKIFGNI